MKTNSWWGCFHFYHLTICSFWLNRWKFTCLLRWGFAWINLLRDILLFYFVEYWGVLISFKIKSGLSLWLRNKCTRDTFDNEDFRQIFTSISFVSMEKAIAPDSSTLAWKIPWTEFGGLQSMGSQTVGHDWVTSFSLFTFLHWRRKWHRLQCSCLENPRDGKPGGLPSMGLHRVRDDWSDLA